MILSIPTGIIHLTKQLRQRSRRHQAQLQKKDLGHLPHGPSDHTATTKPLQAEQILSLLTPSYH